MDFLFVRIGFAIVRMLSRYLSSALRGHRQERRDTRVREAAIVPRWGAALLRPYIIEAMGKSWQRLNRGKTLSLGARGEMTRGYMNAAIVPRWGAAGCAPT